MQYKMYLPSGVDNQLEEVISVMKIFYLHNKLYFSNKVRNDGLTSLQGVDLYFIYIFKSVKRSPPA